MRRSSISSGGGGDGSPASSPRFLAAAA